MTDITPGRPGERLPDAPAAPPLEPMMIPRHLWLVAFIVGAVAWVAGVVATALTDDTILVPNIIILGTFPVPVCTLLFVLSRPREAHVRTETLMLAFLTGGTAGLVLSAVTEVYLLPPAVGTNVGIGFIEEGGKGLVVLAVATIVRPRVPRDGMVLGATIGAGFAAFDSAGYALRVLIDNVDDHPMLKIVQTEAFRGILAPFGHITWTAILGGALFASAWATGHFRVDRRVAFTFVGVVTLHALWDASYGWGIRISEGLGGEGWTLGWPDTSAWVGTPTGADLTRFQAVYDGMLAVVATIGLVCAVRRWRAYQIDRWRTAHAEHADIDPAAPEPAA